MGTVRRPAGRTRASSTNQARPRMVVKMMDLDVLIPYGRNPRKRPAAAVDAVAASLKQFGWQQAIVVDSQNVIVAGHTRHAAALQLGLTTAPVVVIPDDQAAAYRLVDNRSGEFTAWDDELLRAELDALPSLDGLSLEVFDFEALLKPAQGFTGPDDVPDPPAKAISKRGDVWTLGGHRLMCGDATDAGDVGRLLDGAIRGGDGESTSAPVTAWSCRSGHAFLIFFNSRRHSRRKAC